MFRIGTDSSRIYRLGPFIVEKYPFSLMVFAIHYYLMSSNRRDTLTVLSDLLENMSEPRRVTRLLYSSNLSYAQFSKYLKMVKDMGLAEEQKKPFHCYQVTPDGKFFMEMVRKRQEKSIVVSKLT